MGYQESYLTTKNQSDFNMLTTYVKNLGKEYFEEKDAKPVVIITLKKGISVYKTTFPIGMQFLYVVGDRYNQRNINELFDNQCPVELCSWYTESFPSDRIFKGIKNGKMENEYAKFEVLKLSS